MLSVPNVFRTKISSLANVCKPNLSIQLQCAVKNLYVEYYSERNDLMTCYITDSSHFKYFVMKFDPDEHWSNVKCIADSVIVFGAEMKDKKGNYKTVAQKAYSLGGRNLTQ